jgi:putative hydrolase
MKRWERFSDFLENGDWHVHTDYTDGRNTVFEMCEQAGKNGLKLIGFAEHVRKKMNYDFSSLVNDVEKARGRFPGIRMFVGCEAKVLPGGNIDVSEDVLKMCEMVVASFHGFPPVKEEQMNALRKMLINPEVDIWGHPATFLRNCDLSRNEMKDIVGLCIRNKMLVEINTSERYRTPEGFMGILVELGARTVTSSDAHDIWELRKL